MKQNIIRKYKYYIFGAIAVVLIFSIGLSFCAWDSNSIKSALDGSTSTFFSKPQYKLVNDADGNKVASVGDIVTFGNYYQSSTNNNKTPLRWIVVHKEGNILSLLTEEVVAMGSFYNGIYCDSDGVQSWDDPSYRYENSNFAQSKLVKWLNSDYSNGSEGLVPFSADAKKLSMRGFMNEAFSEDEMEYIVPKNISGIYGYAPNIHTSVGVGNKDYGEYEGGTFKVWVPSWFEIFGTNDSYAYGSVSSGLPNTQFTYFDGTNINSNNNTKAVAKTTPFAATPSKSNFSSAKDTSSKYNLHRLGYFEIGVGGNLHWWLRSPRTDTFAAALIMSGSAGHGQTSGIAGVRPAVCVQV